MRHGFTFTSPSERYRTKYRQPNGGKRPCIAKRTMSIKKVMYVIFFTNQGPAIQIAVPKGKSVNTRFYKGNVLHKLKKYFLSRRPATGVRLLHDNASSHKAAIVREYLKQERLLSFRTLLIRQILPLVTRGSKNTSLEVNIKCAKLSVRLFSVSEQYT